MELAIATNDETREFHADDAPLVAALRARGVTPVACVWDDAGVDWRRRRAVLVRTIWDYFRKPAAFAAWLDALAASGADVVNPVATLRWNADKGYLAELEAAGVPSIPTRRVEAADAHALATALEACPWDDLVVKPAMSGGAWRTQRVARAALAGAALAELATHGPLLVQPYVPEVAAEGEWSLLFFAGRYSHAVLKRPAPRDFRVQHKHGGRAELATPERALVDAAAAVLDAAARLGHADLAYARVDGVVVDGRFRLMELEVIEPQLFLSWHPPAGDAFADVLVARLQG
jgi:glutathione synthase/RimK-type ligase-like ATP-grasp enzyme